MTSRTVFIAAGVWALVVVLGIHLLQFPGSVPDFVRATDGGVLLDAQPAFTPDGIYRRLDEYGEAGRRNYSFRNVTTDLVLPLSLLPFLLLLSRRSVASYALRPLLRRILLALPIAYVVFDLVENATVLALLVKYPLRMDALAATLPFTTLVKRAASLLAIVIPLAMLAFRAVRSKRPAVQLR
jgi:hypothetical protein